MANVANKKMPTDRLWMLFPSKPQRVSMRHVLAFVFVCFTCSFADAHSADGNGSSRLVENLQLRDIDGERHSFDGREDRRALVLVFVTTDCPIANSYQPHLARLGREFQGKGFQFVLIHEGPGQTPEKLRFHAKEFEVAFPIVMDADHSIARKLGATKTPEVVVIGLECRIIYQGRIDDLHQGFGKKRASATREDLRIALKELDSGRSISVPKTESVGCSIPVAFEGKK